MSKVIAVAGGTGGIGQHVLEGLITHTKHRIILLSRNPQPEYTKRGVEVKVIDYNSIDSIKAALQGVDTVISCVFALQGFVEGQKNLINASVAAGVKRFIPSEWSGDVSTFPNLLAIVFQVKTDIREYIAKTPLEYTLVCNGLFMDYLLPKGAKRFLKDVPLPVDIENATADIPGEGNEPISFTLADDIGKAVAILVDQPKWEKYTFIHGDTITFNKLVELGEKITGKKFVVKYQPKEELQTLVENAKDIFTRFYAENRLAMAQGNGEYLLSQKGNFPGVQFTTVEELLKRTYRK